MQKFFATPLLLLCLVFPAGSHASVEYLRVEGLIDSDYGPSHPGYNPDYEFSAGQTIFFDFLVYTVQDSPGRTDSDFADFFLADYLNGSVAGDDEHYGLNARFPDGVTTFLYLQNKYLLFGGEFEDSNGFDKHIDNWVIGTQLSLMSNGHDSDAIIGALTLTYRSKKPLSPIPLPAAAWFLGTAVAGLGWFGRRKQHEGRLAASAARE